MTATFRLRPGLRLADVQRALALYNWNIAFRSVYDTVGIVTGFIFIDYALSLGISKERTGLFLAVTNLACILQVASLWLFNHIRRRKLFTRML